VSNVTGTRPATALFHSASTAPTRLSGRGAGPRLYLAAIVPAHQGRPVDGERRLEVGDVGLLRRLFRLLRVDHRDTRRHGGLRMSIPCIQALNQDER
jgi:hypothetical protein